MEVKIEVCLLSKFWGLRAVVTSRRLWPGARGVSVGPSWHLTGGSSGMTQFCILLTKYVTALPLPLDLHAAIGQAKMPCQTFRYPFGGGTSPR